jgi:PiT family inorganic phosphate transporter
MGVGAIKRFSAVRWGVTTKILYAWIFTLPGAALLASLIYYLIGTRVV